MRAEPPALGGRTRGLLTNRETLGSDPSRFDALARGLREVLDESTGIVDGEIEGPDLVLVRFDDGIDVVAIDQKRFDTSLLEVCGNDVFDRGVAQGDDGAATLETG